MCVARLFSQMQDVNRAISKMRLLVALCVNAVKWYSQIMGTKAGQGLLIGTCVLKTLLID